ncbi:UNVERIFIED_CONTAM: hypothetical protein FKN15_064668 [Acipenser sinensis]
MVESTGGNGASTIASAPCKEASEAVLLDTLGTEAGRCQEDLISSRKSGNTRKSKMSFACYEFLDCLQLFGGELEWLRARCTNASQRWGTEGVETQRLWGTGGRRHQGHRCMEH